MIVISDWEHSTEKNDKKQKASQPPTELLWWRLIHSKKIKLRLIIGLCYIWCILRSHLAFSDYFGEFLSSHGYGAKTCTLKQNFSNGHLKHARNSMMYFPYSNIEGNTRFWIEIWTSMVHISHENKAGVRPYLAVLRRAFSLQTWPVSEQIRRRTHLLGRRTTGFSIAYLGPTKVQQCHSQARLRNQSALWESVSNQIIYIAVFHNRHPDITFGTNALNWRPG